ncbi:MAG: VPDSG-CTERM sorting domain-containing protein [Akkermansiaceae bacterium]|nr:VPDSG-CTERM sorting domain-containing protein [Akkermansiaceae bacterium]
MPAPLAKNSTGVINFATLPSNPFLFAGRSPNNSAAYYSSDPLLNFGKDRMATFLVTAYLTVPGSQSGGFTTLAAPAYVIAFEDGSDNDYNDLVVEVTGVAPSTTGSSNIPDGGTTLVLLGGALTGLAGLRRKFRA